MKTAMIARFVMGAAAIFAAAGLVGCGAETGQGAAEGVGQTSEALSTAAGTSLGAGLGRTLAGACAIDDRGTEKVAVIAGFDGSPAPLSDIQIYTPGTGWAQAKDSSGNNLLLPDAVGYVKAIQDPNDVHSCILVGRGTTIGGAAFAASAGHPNVQKLTVDVNGKFSLTTLASLPRVRGEIKACGNSVIYFGGLDNTGAAVSTIDFMDTSAGSPTWATAGTMNVSRYDLGVAQDDLAVAGDKRTFVVSSAVAAGALDSRISLLKATNTNCTTFSLGNTAAILNTVRRGGVVVRDKSVAAKYFVTAGQDNASTPNSLSSTEWVTVTWANTPPTIATQDDPMTSADDIPSLPAATYLPTFVEIPGAAATSVDHILGGYATGAVTFTTNGVQQAKATLWNNKANLAIGRADGIGVYLPSTGKIYFATGKETAGPSLPLTVVEITP